ncbi:hypothetical protein [Pseudonocardia lacus]|uniref:hypothetical protein n=1 Tax=Pseudonocardia lacus TaxID=2835865 RepID=UPI001BDD1048|nr:hypothetical protein [Pseudonocardia lacus]
MTDALIFISTHAVPADTLPELRELSAQFVASAREEEPWSAGLHVFLDEDRHELTYVQVQPSADAMDRHLRLARERIGRAVALAPPVRVTVYGAPGPVLAEALRVNAEAGARVSVVADRLAGFQRPVAA